MATTYHVGKMRAIVPSAKVAERNPELFVTIKGEFRTEDGNSLTITSKAITNDMAKSPEFRLDIPKGILTVPSGQRGRPESESASQADIENRLKAIRTATK